jgi:hypothetical protein
VCVTCMNLLFVSRRIESCIDCRCDLQGAVVRSMRLSDLIGYRTPPLPACSAVPQPTALSGIFNHLSLFFNY